MLAARAGFLAGLLITAVFGFNSPHAHQGKRTQRPLEASLRRSVVRLGRLPSTLLLAGTVKHGSSASGRPVVRITHGALVRWARVAICEEGGWGAAHDAHGPTYYGNLGWLDATWQMFRRPDFPRRMDQASVTEQVWAAQRFANYYHIVPDQRGCTGGY